MGLKWGSKELYTRYIERISEQYFKIIHKQICKHGVRSKNKFLAMIINNKTKGQMLGSRITEVTVEVAEAAVISDLMSDLSEEITIDLVVAALLITSATITMVVTMSATSHQVAEVSTEDSTIEEERITSAMQAEEEAEEDLMEGTGHLHPTMASAEEAIEVEEVASEAVRAEVDTEEDTMESQEVGDKEEVQVEEPKDHLKVITKIIGVETHLMMAMKKKDPHGDPNLKSQQNLQTVGIM